MKCYIGTRVVEAEPLTYCGQEGFKVVDLTGHDSWMPKEEFDDIYHPVSDLNFGEALFMLKQGHRLARKGWNGNGIFIVMQVPDAYSKMTAPYIYIDTTELVTANDKAPKVRVPWLASQTDMLANDWRIV